MTRPCVLHESANVPSEILEVLESIEATEVFHPDAPVAIQLDHRMRVEEGSWTYELNCVSIDVRLGSQSHRTVRGILSSPGEANEIQWHVERNMAPEVPAIDGLWPGIDPVNHTPPDLRVLHRSSPDRRWW